MSDLKKRGLGRGLSALMSSPPAGTTPPSAIDVTAAARNPTYFAAAIEDVYPMRDQPRRVFAEAELDGLAASIRVHGVLQPLAVRPRQGGGYELIAGERRWRAAQRAGHDRVPVVVQDVDSKEAFERALVENLQRQDLNPLEEAAAFQRLVEQFGLSHDQIADRVGKDCSTIANAIRLLRLPVGVRELVEGGRLTMGHARALLGMYAATVPADDHSVEVAARTVVAKGLSVRATEELVRRHGNEVRRQRPRATTPAKSPAVRDLQDRMTRSLGGPVAITEDGSGVGGKGGTIVIRYLDLDHLDRLLERLL